MDTNLDIMYYDYMIESSIEDQKIMELIYNSKFNSLLNESTDEIAIYEANIIQTIMESINKIFDKVINFIKDLVERISGRLIFKADKNLIEKVKDKIKFLTSSERDKFQLISIDFTDNLNDNLSWSAEIYERMNATLIKSTDLMNQFLESNKRNKKPFHKISDDELNKINQIITDFNEELNERANTEKLRTKAKNVNFNNIKDTLTNYSKSDESMKIVNTELNRIVNSMKRQQNIINMHTRDNRTTIIGRKDQSQLVKYRELISYSTSSIIKLCKFQVNMHVLIHRNEESILRRFLNAINSDSMVDADYRVVESLYFGDDCELFIDC